MSSEEWAATAEIQVFLLVIWSRSLAGVLILARMSVVGGIQMQTWKDMQNPHKKRLWISWLGPKARPFYHCTSINF